MDSKVLYPNFHAEVHRYKVASAPSSSGLKNNSKQPKQQSPVSSSRSGGSRPNSSSSRSSHKGPFATYSSLGRPSSSSSPQKHSPRALSSATRASPTHSGNNSTPPSASSTARRRMLQPCIPTATANLYAVAENECCVASHKSSIQAFTRQTSFCRIQDFDEEPTSEYGDDLWSASNSTNDGDDDAESPEVLLTTNRRHDTSLLDSRRSSFSLLKKPPSRQTAIRGELELFTPALTEDTELSPFQDAGAARRNSVSLTATSDPRPASTSSYGGGIAFNIWEVASLLQCSSENLQELVFNARPRSRYARREYSRQSGRTLDRIPSTAAPPLTTMLASTTSAPVLPSSTLLSPKHAAHELSRNKSASGLLGGSISSNSRQSRSDSTRALDSSDNSSSNQQKPGITQVKSSPSPAVSSTWDDNDLSSFFLTELDAKSVKNQWKLARCTVRGAFFLYGTCEFSKAAGHLSEALELAQKTPGDDDDGLIALLSHHIGIALKEDGKLAWAQEMQEKALGAAQRAKENRIRGRALKALGVLFMDVNEPEKALDHQQEALAIALTEKDPELEARMYANLGNIASLQMQFGHALSCHKRDLRLSTLPHAQSAVGQLRAHRNLALVYSKLNKSADLQRQHEQQVAFWASSLMASSSSQSAAPLVSSKAFEADMKAHPHSGIGNICMQLTKRDAKLETMIVNSIRDLFSELQQQQNDSSNNNSSTLNDTGPVAAVQPMQVKQVLITRATDRFKPPRTTMLGNSSSMKRLS